MTYCTRSPRRRFVQALAVLSLLVPLIEVVGPAQAQTVDGVPGPHGGDNTGAAQAGADAGQPQSNAVLQPAVAAETAAAPQPAFATYRVFATRYDPNTPGSVEVAVPDKCAKFAALGWTGALSDNACGAGYTTAMDWRVSVTLDSGGSATIPVKEVGPWNVDDNYWDPATGSARPRRRFADLPTGTPESQAAFSNGYNSKSNCTDLDEHPYNPPRNGGADQFGRCVLNPAGIDLSTAAFTQLGLTTNAWVTVSFLWEPSNATYVPLTPSRLLDTRTNGAKLGAGASLDLGVTGVGGVPTSGVSAVVLNVTATNLSGPASFLTVFPAGSPRPLASTLNMTQGATVPNLTVARVGAGGRVSIYNNLGTVDVVVDVQGWYATTTAGGSRYNALPPSRVLDTRSGSPVPGGTSIDLTVAGAGGVPATGVTAVALNVTATNLNGAESFVTAYPAGAGRPLASNLNVFSGRSTANLVIVQVSDGRISLYNNAGTVDLAADVQGWFGSGGATMVSVPPVRDLDTRNGGGAVAPAGTISLTVAGVNGVPPSGVTAVVLNVTVTNTSGPESFLTVFPSGTGRPEASNINFLQGQTVANLVIARVGPDGKILIYNNLGTVDVVADVQAWFV